MNLKQAKKNLGHSITQREFLALAGDLGFPVSPDADWTQEQVEAIRDRRTFSPSLAGKQIRLSAGEFEAKAAELGLTPPWRRSDVDAVRDRITPDFPGLTSEQVAERLDCNVVYVRRYSLKRGIGKLIPPGCYLVGGARRRFGGSPRAYSEADVGRLREAIPQEAQQIVVRVPTTREIRARADEEARKRGPLTGEDVLGKIMNDAARKELLGVAPA